MATSEATRVPGSELTPGIVCNELSKTFSVVESAGVWKVLLSDSPSLDGHRALARVDLEVARGEFVGVLGRNGAGKSTLLRLIGGAFAPSHGVALLNGSSNAIYELGVGIAPALTGRQFARQWLGWFQDEELDVDQTIEDIRIFSELREYFDRPVRTYSTGMAARLNFAVAAARQADIYLIDEILSVGDENFQAKCWRRLRERLEQGASGILATHDWSSLLKLCERAYTLRGGELVDHGECRDVVRRYLDMPRPTRQRARFGEGLPGSFSAVSGEDVQIHIPVEVDQGAQVVFSASIEQFGGKVGWEHLLHLPKTPVPPGGAAAGIRLTVDAMPLVPGRYALNVFLTALDDDEHFFDARSWLYGNALELDVAGDSVPGVLRLRPSWRRGR